MIGKLVGCLILLLAGIGGWLWFTQGNNPILGGLARPPSTTDWGRVVLGYVMTVAGVVLGTGFRRASALQQQGRRTIADFPAFASGILRATDLWMGVFAAPIVAGIVFSSA